jgi:hypothetical protein
LYTKELHEGAQLNTNERDIEMLRVKRLRMRRRGDWSACVCLFCFKSLLRERSHSARTRSAAPVVDLINLTGGAISLGLDPIVLAVG